MKSLRESLVALKLHNTQENLAETAASLLAGKVLAPAVWDKEPSNDGRGQLIFPANTTISLMVIENDKGDCFFPVFTSQEALAAWDDQARSLVLTFDQLMHFVDMAEGVQGIVLDTNDLNIRLERPFLRGVQTANKKIPVHANALNKGERITVRDVEGHDQLKQKLAANAARLNIQAVWLKERLYPNKDLGWLVVAEVDNPAKFHDLAQGLAPLLENRKLEFMLASSEIGRKIAAASLPLTIQ
jgi:hypothetical protein